MFSETTVWEPITKLRFEFLDTSKKTHKIELWVSTGKFFGPPITPDKTYNNIDPTTMEFDSSAPVPPMTPELQAYLKEMDMFSAIQDKGVFSDMQDRFDEMDRQAKKKKWWSMLRWQKPAMTPSSNAPQTR